MHLDESMLCPQERPVETAFRIDAHVSVMATPGHTCSDVSVVVSGTQHGTVVVAGAFSAPWGLGPSDPRKVVSCRPNFAPHRN